MQRLLWQTLHHIVDQQPDCLVADHHPFGFGGGARRVDDRNNPVRDELVLLAPLVTDGVVHELRGDEARLVRQNSVQAAGGLLIADEHCRRFAQ
ncbi:hypothetical protein D3C79_707760 [compost metagenome]